MSDIINQHGSINSQALAEAVGIDLQDVDAALNPVFAAHGLRHEAATLCLTRIDVSFKTGRAMDCCGDLDGCSPYPKGFGDDVKAALAAIGYDNVSIDTVEKGWWTIGIDIDTATSRKVYRAIQEGTGLEAHVFRAFVDRHIATNPAPIKTPLDARGWCQVAASVAWNLVRKPESLRC